MSGLSPGNLMIIAQALVEAYPTEGAVDQLLAGINESFAVITDDSLDHETRVQDAVADLASRGPGPLLRLLAAALSDPRHAANVALRETLTRVVPQRRWELLDTTGFVLKRGPFVDRSNLKRSIGRLFVSRRVLRVGGGGGVRGRSWSCQLLEREAKLRGAPYVKIDLRDAPVAGRESPAWLAEALHQGVFVDRARPNIAGYAETRLIEALTSAWVPLAPPPALVVIDHLGDGNVQPPVREYAASLALAVVEGQLEGLRLVLIDGPPGLDLSEYALQTIEDVVEPVTVEHVSDFFGAAVDTLFPGVQPARRQALIDTAVAPLTGKLPSSASEGLAIAVRDALEAMAENVD